MKWRKIGKILYFLVTLDESMTKGRRDVKETLLMMGRVDAKLADRRKKLKKSG